MVCRQVRSVFGPHIIQTHNYHPPHIANKIDETTSTICRSIQLSCNHYDFFFDTSNFELSNKCNEKKRRTTQQLRNKQLNICELRGTCLSSSAAAASEHRRSIDNNKRDNWILIDDIHVHKRTRTCNTEPSDILNYDEWFRAPLLVA